MRLIHLVDPVERARVLDPAVERLRDTVRRVLATGRVRDALQGVPLGHPLHPVLVQVPLGTWVSASVLDAASVTGPAPGLLVATGIAAAVPAVAAGLADYTELHEQQQRVALVHAAANTAALALYATSFYHRLRGHDGAGKMYSLLGLGAAGAGGFLGGHLTYRQAAGANHTEDVPHLLPPGWHVVAGLDELTEGVPIRRTVDTIGVVVVRHGGRVDVLAERCSHLSGPLHEGELVGEGAQACLRCPWHGSTFRLADGEVVSGPATAPQPHFAVHLTDNAVRARLLGAG
jgi:nitrite reductase/ring-hydroxylating ferredoxin subunit/uncharacterized membrane protein